MDLAVVRRNELTEQRAALLAEFANWRDRAETRPAADQPPPLEKHHSQITRITCQLEAYLQGHPLPAATPADSVDTYATAQTIVYFIQRVWAYYREKFALRDVAWLRGDLACADELAWHCYKPAVNAAQKAKTVGEGELKEPPLVFYDPSGSPFVMSRGRLFRPEGVTEEEERKLGETILALPIPVIGVPWFQVNHLPSAVAIAHEVGHAVWWDFEVRPALEEAFETMSLADEAGGLPRRAIWLRWLPELFADAYAVAVLGTAFVLGLSAYLSDPVDVVRNEEMGVIHPPAALRIKINCALLKELRLADEGVEAAWDTTYHRDSKPFGEDVPTIAETLLKTRLPKFGNAAIRAVLKPPKNVEGLADKIGKGFVLPDNPDFRQLFAAASLLFHRHPEIYAQLSKDGDLAKKFSRKIPEGTRGVPKLPEQLRQQGVADRAAAERLFDALIGQTTTPGGT